METQNNKYNINPSAITTEKIALYHQELMTVALFLIPQQVWQLIR